MKTRDAAVQGIIDNIRRIFQVINEQSREIEKKTGVTGPQLWALQLVGNHLGIGVKDLAAKMFLTPSTVVGILDRLEEKGLVARKREKSDRRCVRLNITPHAESIVSGAPDVAQNRIIGGLSKLSEENIFYVSAGLRRLVEILDAQNIRPRPLQPSVPSDGRKEKKKTAVASRRNGRR